MSENQIKLAQEEIERKEMEERIYPKVWNDSIDHCYKAMIITTKSISDTLSTLDKCDNILKENNYPINSKSPSYKQWGLAILERALESHRNEKGKTV